MEKNIEKDRQEVEKLAFRIGKNDYETYLETLREDRYELFCFSY